MLSRDTRQEEWFGHPKGLTILFLTEMWEKFSYYGMRSLLVYYLVTTQAFSQKQASLLYGLYTGCCYLTPVFGGVIADRWLGRRRAVLIGGTIMACGHFMMTFDALLYAGLATIALGNGLFLPSLPGQIRNLYGSRDARMGTAFNVYYVGVNLGAFIAPLLCGTLGELAGWHWGFGAAGIGMVVGVCIYAFGNRYLVEGGIDDPVAGREPAGAMLRLTRRDILCLGSIILLVVLFRGAYEQAGNTLALWAKDEVDRSVGHWSIPMTWFQSLNSLLVFVLTPMLLHYLARRRQSINDLVKMSMGAAIVSASYLLIVGASLYSAYYHQQTPWIWLVLFFTVYTLGELLILPVGLGLFGRLLPSHLAATGIAAWFTASFMGNLLGGALGTLWSLMAAPVFLMVMASCCAISSIALYGLGRTAWGREAGAR